MRGDSVLVYWLSTDRGLTTPPNGNEPPRVGEDPHERPTPGQGRRRPGGPLPPHRRGGRRLSRRPVPHHRRVRDDRRAGAAGSARAVRAAVVMALVLAALPAIADALPRSTGAAAGHGAAGRCRHRRRQLAGRSRVGAVRREGARRARARDRRVRRPLPPLDPAATELRRAVPARLPRPRRSRAPTAHRVALVKSDSYLAQDLLTRRAAQILANGLLGHRLRPARPDGDPQPLVALPHHAGSRGVGVPGRDGPAGLRVPRPSDGGRGRSGGGRPPSRPHGRHRRRAPHLQGQHRRSRRSPTTARPRATPTTTPTSACPSSASTTCPGPRPSRSAVFVNHGQHPESLDAYDLITEDYLAPLAADGRPGPRGHARVQPGRRRIVRRSVPAGATPRCCPTGSCGRGRTSGTRRPSGAPGTSPTASSRRGRPSGAATDWCRSAATSPSAR